MNTQLLLLLLASMAPVYSPPVESPTARFFQHLALASSLCGPYWHRTKHRRIRKEAQSPASKPYTILTFPHGTVENISRKGSGTKTKVLVLIYFLLM